MGATSLMNKDFKIVEKRKLFTAVSGAIVLIAIIVGIIFAAIPGASGFFSLGLDFEGGYSLTVEVNGLTKQNYKQNYEQIKNIVENVKDDEGKDFGVRITRNKMQVLEESARILIRYEAVSTDLPITVDEYMTAIVNPAIKKALDKDFSGGAEVSLVKANALFAIPMTREKVAMAMFTLSLALVVTLIYILFRYKAVMGFTAAAAMLHQVLISVAFMTISRFEISSNFFAALTLSLVFTVINTIVLFVKTREELRAKDNSPAAVANRAVKASLPLVIGVNAVPLAAGIVLAVVCSVLGLGEMNSFTYPLVFGLAAGLYSSMCIAPSLWVVLKNRNIKVSTEAKRAAKKK